MNLDLTPDEARALAIALGEAIESMTRWAEGNEVERSVYRDLIQPAESDKRAEWSALLRRVESML